MEARIKRQDAMQQARRTLVLDAARRTFAELGMERSTMREIAKAAGYTPGAIYSYFPSKQALVHALLTQVLDALSQEVLSVKVAKNKPAELMQAQGRAWIGYWCTHAQERMLMLSWLAQNGAAQDEVAQGQQVRQQLLGTLQPVANSWRALGATDDGVEGALSALLEKALGLLLLAGAQADSVSVQNTFAAALQQALDAQLVNTSTVGVADVQVDLFAAPLGN